MNSDISDQLQTKIQQAFEHNKPLAVVAGNSKSFYGRMINAETLNVGGHQGILNYEPTELVITARAGTTLREIENVLHENNQMLGFEPPAFSDTATIGGTLACNLSGPRRVSCGAARDFLLGTKIINGKAEVLRFGGEVMKNVAGYDASRLMAGALGTLGVLLELSFKVLPRPETEATCVFECDIEQALEYLQQWGQKPFPISSSCYTGDKLYVRLSGSEQAVSATQKSLGGEVLQNADQFWQEIKEHQSDFFQNGKTLWRISIAADAEPLKLEGECLYEWGGALRWLSSDEPEQKVRTTAENLGGHAVCFRSMNNIESKFQPLSAGLLRIHKNLKNAFDPKGILNPGKMYPEF